MQTCISMKWLERNEVFPNGLGMPIVSSYPRQTLSYYDWPQWRHIRRCKKSTCLLDTIQNFLWYLGMKPYMHQVEISLKIRIYWSLNRFLIILVDLAISWYSSEKMMVSTKFTCCFMLNLHNKFWMVSSACLASLLSLREV